MPTSETVKQTVREQGAVYLSDAQLLESLLEVSQERAKRILEKGQGIAGIASRTQGELMAQHDITERQSRLLTTAAALASRVNAAALESKPQISCPADAAVIFAPGMANALQEQLEVLVLNTRNRVLERRLIYVGTVNNAPARPAEILRPAVMLNAPNIIVAHNHPSGETTPSPEDIAITREIVAAGKMMGIEVLDHLVIGKGNQFTSLKEKSLGFG